MVFVVHYGCVWIGSKGFQGCIANSLCNAQLFVLLLPDAHGDPVRNGRRDVLSTACLCRPQTLLASFVICQLICPRPHKLIRLINTQPSSSGAQTIIVETSIQILCDTFSRVRKTWVAGQHCIAWIVFANPESSFWLKNFRIIWTMSGCFTSICCKFEN